MVRFIQGQDGGVRQVDSQMAMVDGFQNWSGERAEKKRRNQNMIS